MNPERWRQVRDVYERAIEIATAGRSSYLDRACAADADLRQEVESLLGYQRSADSHFLKQPAVDLLEPLPAIIKNRMATRLGVYQILEQIGHGGMGEVYRARRVDGQYEKEVAVKLVRGGYDSDSILRRFRQERQILASLDHPNIARLLDGGTTEDGLPYLVMELIYGIPIDQYCDHHELSVDERLQLFLQVCSAVQYAHQRLVIHRDLKPGNILVTKEGAPKLLDFGIAKLLDTSSSPETTLVAALTPEYASPEQIRGEMITTATDVYALGVVLYRLLTGRSPYRATTRNPAELARIVSEVEAERPSSAIKREDSANEGASPSNNTVKLSGSDLIRLSRQFKGDIDHIVLKSLRKEPERRYVSVEQFAEDIRRHLQHLPVTATPDSRSYRIQKFVRRHRKTMLAAAMIVIAIAVGFVATWREARIAARNERRAEARFNDVRKLANSLIFEVHDSMKDLPGALHSRQVVLQKALEYLDSLATESQHEADLQRELAAGYEKIGDLQGNPLSANIGDAKAALVSYQKALKLRESLARLNPSNSSDQVELAIAYAQFSDFQAEALGNIEAGLEYCRKAVAILDREAMAQPNNFRIIEQNMRAHVTLGFLQIGNGANGSAGSISGGIAALENALELYQQATRLESSDIGVRGHGPIINAALGDALLKLGNRTRALNHYERALDALTSINTQTRNIITSINAVVITGKIADAYLIDGNIQAAIRWYSRTRKGAEQLLATDPNNEAVQSIAITSSGQLGHALVEGGQTRKGLDYIREAFARAQRRPSQTPLIRIFQSLLRIWIGEVNERKGQVVMAAQDYVKSKDLLRTVRVGGTNDLRTQVYYCSATERYGAALLQLHRLKEAKNEYDECLTLLEPLSHANPDNPEVLYALAETYTGEGSVLMKVAEERPRIDKVETCNAAGKWFQNSLNVWSKVPNPSRYSTSTLEVTLPGEISRRVAACGR